jgi:hypothetical protein
MPKITPRYECRFKSKKICNNNLRLNDNWSGWFFYQQNRTHVGFCEMEIVFKLVEKGFQVLFIPLIQLSFFVIILFHIYSVK